MGEKRGEDTRGRDRGERGGGGKIQAVKMSVTAAKRSVVVLSTVRGPAPAADAPAMRWNADPLAATAAGRLMWRRPAEHRKTCGPGDPEGRERAGAEGQRGRGPSRREGRTFLGFFFGSLSCAKKPASDGARTVNLSCVMLKAA